jgi:hypothetical protein
VYQQLQIEITDFVSCSVKINKKVSERKGERKIESQIYQKALLDKNKQNQFPLQSSTVLTSAREKNWLKVFQFFICRVKKFLNYTMNCIMMSYFLV